MKDRTGINVRFTEDENERLNRLEVLFQQDGLTLKSDAELFRECLKCAELFKLYSEKTLKNILNERVDVNMEGVAESKFKGIEKALLTEAKEFRKLRGGINYVIVGGRISPYEIAKKNFNNPNENNGMTFEQILEEENKIMAQRIKEDNESTFVLLEKMDIEEQQSQPEEEISNEDYYNQNKPTGEEE